MSTRALLDTHSFIWFIEGSQRLSARARALIEAEENSLSISIASLWEISIKHSLGKLGLARPFAELIPQQLAQQQIEVLQIEIPHLVTLVSLPMHHRDPFDRLLAAQALSEDLQVIGVDPALDSYGVERLW